MSLYGGNIFVEFVDNEGRSVVQVLPQVPSKVAWFRSALARQVAQKTFQLGGLAGLCLEKRRCLRVGRHWFNLLLVAPDNDRHAPKQTSLRPSGRERSK